MLDHIRTYLCMYVKYVCDVYVFTCSTYVCTYIRTYVFTVQTTYSVCTVLPLGDQLAFLCFDKF